MRPLLFYFDYLSSNAYLAWTQLPKLAARFDLEIEPIPVLFAGLLGAHGQLGPAEVRPKAYWMARNNLRKAALLGVRLEPPRHHPWNPLLSLRVCSLPMLADRRTALIDVMFQATWVRGLHMSEPAVIASLADEVGLPGEALVTAAGQPAAKAKLREQTDAAIAVGVFGVPTMRVGGDLFWGYDDWPYLELFLAGKDPIAADAMGKWTGSVRPSATRRQFRERQGA